MQLYTIKNYVFEVMELEFTEEYRRTRRLTQQKSKRGVDRILHVGHPIVLVNREVNSFVIE